MDKPAFYGSPDSFREKGGSQHQCFGIEVVPGTRCQLNCQGCYKKSAFQAEQYGDTPLDVTIDYIDQARAEGFSEVAFLGGEPTLHRNIFTIIHETRRMGLRPILCTNGMSLSSPEAARQLEGTGTVVVTHASFPGGEEAIARHHVLSADGGFRYAEMLSRAIENLRRTEGITLVMEMPLTEGLFPHAFDFFRHCRETNVIPFIEICRPADDGSSVHSVTPEQVHQLFEQCRRYDLEHVPEKAPNAVHPPAYDMPCTMSITGVHVKNRGGGDYGKVYSCCAQKVCHGDLREQRLHEILSSPTLAVFQRQDDYIVGPCRDCDIYNVCRGGCRGTATLKFGCPRASSPACHRIPPDVREDITRMAPASCEGCPAEGANQCRIGRAPFSFIH